MSVERGSELLSCYHGDICARRFIVYKLYTLLSEMCFSVMVISLESDILVIMRPIRSISLTCTQKKFSSAFTAQLWKHIFSSKILALQKSLKWRHFFENTFRGADFPKGLFGERWHHDLTGALSWSLCTRNNKTHGWHRVCLCPVSHWPQLESVQLIFLRTPEDIFHHMLLRQRWVWTFPVVFKHGLVTGEKISTKTGVIFCLLNVFENYLYAFRPDCPRTSSWKNAIIFNATKYTCSFPAITFQHGCSVRVLLTPCLCLKSVSFNLTPLWQKQVFERLTPVSNKPVKSGAEFTVVFKSNVYTIFFLPQNFFFCNACDIYLHQQFGSNTWVGLGGLHGPSHQTAPWADRVSPDSALHLLGMLSPNH